MKMSSLVRSLLPFISLLGFVVTSSSMAGTEEAVSESDHLAIARGAYLVTVGGCNDCHTPKVMGPTGPHPDETRLLSGHPEGELFPTTELGRGWVAATNEHLTAWQGPWGRTYAMNLTPDENTGIGIWTEDMFTRAIREGRHMGQSRPIMPPMPWENYSQLTDADLHAVWMYLRSLPPIVNRIPDFEPAPTPDEKEDR